MNDELRARLRRMRREDGPAAPADAAARARQRGELGAQLSRRAARVAQRAGSRRGEPEGLAPESNAFGTCVARCTRYPLTTRHGTLPLGAALEDPLLEWACLGQDAALRALCLQDAVFVDTETTGLHGGAGTQVFLIGIGRFRADAFELWQGFLRDPVEEPALLEACARRLEGASGLVSFFGKSFDRHRLHERFAYHGRTSPFLALPHLDLYWPLRRLALPEAEDGRLRTVERLFAGVEREDDLPGSEAPSAWFAYQRGQPHLLDAVFAHHRDDVLSLVVLAGQLARLAVGSSQELRGRILAARCLTKSKDARAAECWHAAWEAADLSTRRELALEVAGFWRRQRDAARALACLEVLHDAPVERAWFDAVLERVRIHARLARDAAAARREIAAARARLCECGVEWLRAEWARQLEACEQGLGAGRRGASS